MGQSIIGFEHLCSITFLWFFSSLFKWVEFQSILVLVAGNWTYVPILSRKTIKRFCILHMAMLLLRCSFQANNIPSIEVYFEFYKTHFKTHLVRRFCFYCLIVLMLEVEKDGKFDWNAYQKELNEKSAPTLCFSKVKCCILWIFCYYIVFLLWNSPWSVIILLSAAQLCIVNNIPFLTCT